MAEHHTTNNIQAAEAAAVADIVRKSVEPRVVTIDDGNGKREVLLVPDGHGGMHVNSVKELLKSYRDSPERRKGTAELTELASFVEHVNRFKDADTAIFADRTPTRPCLLAVLDYHRTGATGAPRFGEHRARYAFPLADEWSAWMAQNSKPMPQDGFAQFIEDRLSDVADPGVAGESAKSFCSLLSCGFASASKLLELSRGLSVHVGARVQNHTNLSTGESNVTFATAHADEQGKPIKVPGAFLLALPIFRGGARYQIPARLRYRVNGPSVLWSYDLYRATVAFDHAIAEACETAKTGTGLPLFMGQPE